MPSDTADHDSPTPDFAREIIALYREEALAAARFPDLDLEVLSAAERALAEAQREVERIDAQLSAARQERDAQRVALESKAERALAYARVFATGDEALTARLAEVGRKKPAAAGERAPPKRRGRPKQAANGDELFAAAELAGDTGELGVPPGVGEASDPDGSGARPEAVSRAVVVAAEEAGAGAVLVEDASLPAAEEGGVSFEAEAPSSVEAEARSSFEAEARSTVEAEARSTVEAAGEPGLPFADEAPASLTADVVRAETYVLAEEPVEPVAVSGKPARRPRLVRAGAGR